jgi:hypothetical protein
MNPVGTCDNRVNMKAKVLSDSYVMKFLDVGFNSNQIEEKIETETNNILKMFEIKELSDWEIEFRAVFNQCEEISVYKKLPSYKKEKQKLIYIHIPIPTKAQANWGVEDRQHLKLNHTPNIKNVWLLEVIFTDFDNRTDYITDCLRRAITFCFENGFTVNGVKIKLKNNLL